MQQTVVEQPMRRLCMEDILNTEGYDNDNRNIEDPVSGARQKMPHNYGEQKKMKSTRVISVLTGWNEVCEQGWAQS